jgi:ATP-dependent helicase YprA (DUF1998 family)/very-short-patch-repair endonuclease
LLKLIPVFQFVSRSDNKVKQGDSMNVFDLRNSLIEDYSSYISSFIQIKDPRIKTYVDQSIQGGLLWPDPLIQLNPSFEPGKYIDELCEEGLLNKECKKIFARKSSPKSPALPLRLHKHQEDAIRTAREGHNYILTTGTGSGKSLAYIIPIVDYVLRNGSGKGIRAIIVYPMNALANSQRGELEKFLNYGYPDGKGPVTFARYTGQENDEERQKIMDNPPDILLTNYVMLELILTRPEERIKLVNVTRALHFLVLDELHTYRGRQGADVSMLVRRTREAFQAHQLQCVGTSATLAGAGSFEQQKNEVAKVASIIFGDHVSPSNVIGETLRRTTVEYDFQNSQHLSNLKASIQSLNLPQKFEQFKEHPLASWVESQLGLTMDHESNRLVRAKPKSLTGKAGVAHELSTFTALSLEVCVDALQAILLQGYTTTNPETNFPVFAFRLHQFISRGDTVYASLEEESKRHITVHGQKFVPGEREKVLLPLAFCRECGQEYYVVRKTQDKDTGFDIFLPRELNENRKSDEGEAGFLYLNQKNPWPEELDDFLDRVPEDWLEFNAREDLVVKRSQRKNVPETFNINTSAKQSEIGERVAFTKAPFRFCLNCGVSYDARQSSDFAKLTELSSGGRSTDTTILSMSLVRKLRQELPNLSGKEKEEAQRKAKLLSFTDNRQDASLQAGHFNDFIEISLLRSALYRAVLANEPDGIYHENLAKEVFKSLNLPMLAYASNPEVRFIQLDETQRALREVLGYRIYRDLKRGWRITSPNLEQSGLLKIEYASLHELCNDDKFWQNTHQVLTSANPETRAKVCKVLLDYMRRELAVKVNFLDPLTQESIRQLSSQRLISPWAMDENENMEHASILFPRSRLKNHDEYGGNVYLSPRGGFGQYLRRDTTFPHYYEKIKIDETEEIIDQILDKLDNAGLIQIVFDPKKDSMQKPGYQLMASSMIWKAGDGKQAFHDPIRIPRIPEGGGKTNDFFVNYYQTVDKQLLGIEAREHTAQVPSYLREEREGIFRTGALPILYCSPTMELGVDISELNTVNMRNVPPTPANYAQRSGRAGRSGQPALVFTYCTIGSPHDQYYFKHQALMVSGAVTPPRIDLTNMDLLRSHVYAIWLAESGMKLGSSLKDILDLTDPVNLPCQDHILESLKDHRIRVKARAKAQAALNDFLPELEETDWWSDHWLESTLDQVEIQFNQACDRWRTLYQAAKNQQQIQHEIINDATRSPADRKTAQRLRQEAESQLDLLTESKNLVQSDFYSYRYFASEGFLPGYSFPRLPLSAYIPARRIRSQDDEMLSRPRFLAISEFGPRSIIYHEGSRYIINRVNLPVSETGDGFSLVRVKQCHNCGYLHPITAGDGIDNCERCHASLEQSINNLFRLQNVSTRRRDRISSDEEERVRQGYELRTAIRFSDHGGEISVHTAEIIKEGNLLGKLTYGTSAKLWRINVGWRRRADTEQLGFILDIERGYWARKDDEANDPEDPMSSRTLRVVPFVEDTKNCLLFEPQEYLNHEQMASLQAALKNAIQVEYQLQDSELAAEPLPDVDNRRLLLFYEAAEGGAGVLRRLVDDQDAFSRVARQALQICHFDPKTGEDLQRAPNAHEDCEAACYDCLMSYHNQMDHRLLDRKIINEVLLALSQSTTHTSPQVGSREEHYQQLLNLCASDLERDFLKQLLEKNYRLPSHAQHLIEACQTRPDFWYQGQSTAIYIDGYHHLHPDRQARDREKTDCLEDLGITVIRFPLLTEWETIFSKYKNIFGS